MSIRDSGICIGHGSGEHQLDRLESMVSALPDPEIPVVTLGDLGIVREVIGTLSGPVVRLTPTYSGCPATDAIRDEVLATARKAGFRNVRVEIVLAPAWSTRWISAEGRRKLLEYGIAPPLDDEQRATGKGSLPVVRLFRKSSLACPRCGSTDVEEISAWGSTPCKSLQRCLACREPFDYFKPY